MKQLFNHIIPILAVVALTASWAAIQIIAKKLGTKNHIDNAGSCGKNCSCSGGDSCEKTSESPS